MATREEKIARKYISQTSKESYLEATPEEQQQLRDAILSAMREFARERSIGFDEWKRVERYCWNATDKNYYAAWDMYKEYTTIQYNKVFIFFIPFSFYKLIKVGRVDEIGGAAIIGFNIIRPKPNINHPRFFHLQHQPIFLSYKCFIFHCYC